MWWSEDNLLVGISSLLLPCGSQDRTEVASLRGKHLYLLSPLSSFKLGLSLFFQEQLPLWSEIKMFSKVKKER